MRGTGGQRGQRLRLLVPFTSGFSSALASHPASEQLHFFFPLKWEVTVKDPEAIPHQQGTRPALCGRSCSVAIFRSGSSFSLLLEPTVVSTSLLKRDARCGRVDLGGEKKKKSLWLYKQL